MEFYLNRASIIIIYNKGYMVVICPPSDVKAVLHQS